MLLKYIYIYIFLNVWMCYIAVYLRDIWPDKKTIQDVETTYVTPELFKECYAKLTEGGSQRWKELEIPDSKMCQWSEQSTYIHNPPFFQNTKREPEPLQDINNAYVFVFFFL